MADEALTLLKFFQYNDEVMGAVLALCSRAQGGGGTIRAIVTNLEDSERRGSNQARDTLHFYRLSDEALKNMASGLKTPERSDDPSR